MHKALLDNRIFYLESSFGHEYGPSSGRYTRRGKCTETLRTSRLEISRFYLKSTLELYIKRVWLLSNDKRSEDI